jgi:hypothetical protein
MRVRLVGVVALLALVVASCGGAVPEASGPSEGIQVHGDWTIDIYNEDGSLDQGIEFSNDLSFGGPERLAKVLAGVNTPGAWWVAFDSRTVPDAPCPSFCRISEPNYPGAVESEDLTVTIESSEVIVLAGSVVAEQAGEVGTVSTRFAFCEPNVAPDSCNGASGLAPAGSFTFADTFTPVNVEAGQTISIRVDISFTSG